MGKAPGYPRVVVLSQLRIEVIDFIPNLFATLKTYSSKLNVPRLVVKIKSGLLLELIPLFYQDNNMIVYRSNNFLKITNLLNKNFK